MGTVAGPTGLSPMQRLDAIKAASTNPLPELPTATKDAPQIVEAAYSGGSWANLGADTPTLPTPMLAAVDLSSSDFDVVRSIRVWHIERYRFRKWEKDGPCQADLKMQLGTYDASLSFSWSDHASVPVPKWIPLRQECGARFRGVGVEWLDVFGRYDHELIPY